MRITQQEIARLANVSQATVSRVVAGDPRVEPEIRERVQQVMRQHNYRPDVRARSLRTRQTHLVGLVLKRTPEDLQGDPFFSLFVSEILGFLSSTPYHLCVDIAASELRQEHVYDELLRTRRVDGVILVESAPSDDRIKRLQSEGFPFVLVGNPGASNLPSVDNDNVLAGRIATQHLIDQGYSRIGFLTGPEGLTVSHDRAEGYRQAICESGQEPLVVYSDFGFAPARAAAQKMLATHRGLDAMVVLDDYMAMGAIDAAREAHLPIPTGLGVVGFNDTSLCNLVPGGLTSVSLNIEEVVRQACGKLLRIIEGRADGEEPRLIVPSELKVRGSSTRDRKAAMV